MKSWRLVGQASSEIRDDNERFQAEVVLGGGWALQVSRRHHANILTSGLLGEQYIGSTPAVRRRAAPGDVIKKTQSAVVLEKLISQFMFDKAADGEPAPASK